MTDYGLKRNRGVRVELASNGMFVVRKTWSTGSGRDVEYEEEIAVWSSVAELGADIVSFLEAPEPEK